MIDLKNKIAKVAVIGQETFETFQGAGYKLTLPITATLAILFSGSILFVNYSAGFRM